MIVSSSDKPAPPSGMRRGLAFATGVYAAVLVFATHYPKPEELVGGKLPSDKLMHFVAYGLLGILAAATARAYGRRSWVAATGIFLGLAAAAVLDELTQPFFQRAADPLDWVFDAAGLAGGIAFVWAAVNSWGWALGSRRT